MKKYLAFTLLLIVAMGATGNRIDFTPLAPVKLIKANGTAIGYGYGTSTAAGIGTVLLTAITDSVAGDTVRLESDATVSTAIGKDDLHLELADGVTLTCSSASTVSLISDGGSAMDMYISGHGRLVRASNGKGAVIKHTHASSNLFIDVAEIVNQKTSIGSNPDKPNLEGVAVYAEAGDSYVEAQIISGTMADWWVDGDHYVVCQRLEGTGSVEYSIGTYASPPATPVGQYWCNAQHLKAPTPVLWDCTATAGTGAARCWGVFNTIDCNGVDTPKCLIENVVGYLSVQKFNHTTDDTFYSLGTIAIGQGAKAYVTAQKVSTQDNSDSSFIHVYTTGTTAKIDINEVDDSGGLPPLGYCVVDAGTVYYRGMQCALTTASRDAFTCNGGTLAMQGVEITTQSSCKDLVRNAGTLSVSPGVRYDATKTTGTITLQNIYGVAPTAAGVALLDDADASAQRTTLGLGTMATQAASAVAITGGTASGITSAALTSSGTLAWASRSILTSPADGQVLMTNAAGSAFTSLQFGGTTSSFPMLKRSGTFLHARLADDSGYAGFVCNNFSAQGTAVTLSALPSSDPTVAGQLYTDHGVVKASGTDYPVFTRAATILVSDPQGSAITTGDGKACFRVPDIFNGYNLSTVGAACSTVSSSGAPAVQIRRSRRASATTRSDADMLSTAITIDQSEFDTVDAATPAVVNGSNDDVQTGDMIYVDIDTAGTGCKGLVVNLTFQLP